MDETAPRTLAALIFDFGGVLTSPLRDSMFEFVSEEGIELEQLARAALGAYLGEQDDLVTSFETGRISEDDFAVAFARRLSDTSGKSISPEGLVRRIFGRLELQEDMLDAVARARRAGYKTALLSNSWGVAHYPTRRLAPLFDALVISGEVGLRKPDPEIFTLVCERLEVKPETCVFVDDYPGHLRTALTLGMTTVLHRTPERTIQELEDLLGAELRPT